MNHGMDAMRYWVGKVFGSGTLDLKVASVQTDSEKRKEAMAKKDYDVIEDEAVWDSM